MRAKLIIATVLASLATMAVLNVLPAAAVDPPAPVPEALGPRSVFPDHVDIKIKLEGHHGMQVINIDDPSRTAVVKFTLAPGARFPWHTHAGPVVVNVAVGDFTFVDSDTCGETQYTAGQAFVDAGHGHVHTAYNPSTTTTTVVYATFFEAPASGPLSIPAPDPGC